MKYLFLFLVFIYQNFLSYVFKNIIGVNKFCKFSPTCSEYTKQSIQEFGAYQGFVLSIKRLLQCQPFGKAQTI